ncbi:Fatty acid desaturase [Tistlia consotensis]|uniref:Fatty acid desaturase n=1 Tax=Tistlia consotensis USBA 355 TaxID=560819 RepID=A0A1Y6CTI2_9PROT|nr:fatty acid desaturase [Tistlia consotensis]SMF76922.1 Fatty acid desaturase [Tistlia consotensis USBA 355]SNS13434.1 Fatty acid desaturase [Tistlia consotensis]
MQRFDAETAAALKALSTPSDRRGLQQAAGHLGLIVLAGALVWTTRDSPWVLPALLVEGVALVFLFCALHEAVHYTPFASRRLNRALAWLCGLVLLIPPRWFRHFHLAHHRWTQDPGRDPELAAAKPHSLAAYLLHLSGLPVWKSEIATLLRNAAGRNADSFVPPRERAAVTREARIMLAAYALVALLSLALQSRAAVWLWLLPMLAGQPVLRLYLLTEHGGCPAVPDMLRNSRTTQTGPLVRFLAWNMPFHAEHHAWPAAPFHALPRAHALLRERIEVQAPSYRAASRDVFRALVASR